jgi:hypothetical protein
MSSTPSALIAPTALSTISQTFDGTSVVAAGVVTIVSLVDVALVVVVVVDAWLVLPDGVVWLTSVRDVSLLVADVFVSTIVVVVIVLVVVIVAIIVVDSGVGSGVGAGVGGSGVGSGVGCGVLSTTSIKINVLQHRLCEASKITMRRLAGRRKRLCRCTPSLLRSLKHHNNRHCHLVWSGRHTRHNIPDQPHAACLLIEQN